MQAHAQSANRDSEVGGNPGARFVFKVDPADEFGVRGFEFWYQTIDAGADVA